MRRGLLVLLMVAPALGGCDAFYRAAGRHAERTIDQATLGVGYKQYDSDGRCMLDAYLLNCDRGLAFSTVGSWKCIGYGCSESLFAAAATQQGAATSWAPTWPETPAALAWPAPAVSPTQRAALLAFFTAMDGPHWDDSTGWGGPAGSECDWFGVSCDATRTLVTGLVFRDNYLRGQLPAQLSSLTALEAVVLADDSYAPQPFPAVLTSLPNLRVLILVGNAFRGTVPKTIAKLTKLETLVLEDQLLSGPLPPELWTLGNLRILSLARLAGDPALGNAFGGAHPAEVSKLKNLKALNLRGNVMTGPIPSSWTTLVNLESLAVVDNGATGPIPPGLAGLKKLANLSLSTNRLTGSIPEGLGSLPALENLDLSFNQLAGPIPQSINNLTRLRRLALIGNRLSGALPALNGFDELVSLSIGPAGHNGPFPASWMNLRQIQVLMVPKAGITGPFPDLSLFSDLEEVNLEDNAFTPGPVPTWALGSLPDLRKILLSGTNRQGAFPSFTPYKGQLTHLGLGRNPFTAGEVPASIEQLSKLDYLDLEQTNRTGPLPRWLQTAHLQGLSFLDLSDNAFVPGPVPDMPYLHPLSLDLGRTGRTGALPTSLTKQYFMQRLVLADNQLTGPLSRSALPPFLLELDLSRNHLGGPLPADLGSETQLRSLQLSGNQFTGEVPASILYLTVLYPGVLDTALYGQHVGLDLRFNMLTSANASVIAFAKSRHGSAADFRATQTVAPANLKAVAVSPTSVKLSWTPIPFQGPGNYTIQRGLALAGPFVAAGQVAPKSAASFVATGLKAKTKYFFRVTTTSVAAPRSPNLLTSPPGSVVAVSTP